MRAVVVGASVAGVTAAAALRNAGFAGEILVVGAEEHVPYDRPPLSKGLLAGEVEHEDIVLPAARRLAELNVRTRLGSPAVGLDLDRAHVELADGERISYDGLIIATGSAARRLPDQPAAAGIHMLRTLDDAVALRGELAGGARSIVVIGAGFIGLEVAASARSLGVEASVVEVAEAPLSRVLSGQVGAWFSELHESHGVGLHCGVGVAGFDVADERVAGVDLTNGEHLAGDLVVVGVGAAPVTGWLEGCGLTLDDGVVCDASLRAADRVYAAGDVARWDHPLFGSVRVEHWTTAGDHARVAARNLADELTGRLEPTQLADQVPYFWSDQFGVKIQMAGWAKGYDAVHEVGAGSRRAALFGRDGTLVAALAWNWPAFVAKQRRAIGAAAAWSEATEAAQVLVR